MSASEEAPYKPPKAQSIGFLLLAILVTALAVAVNLHFANLWIQYGLDLDSSANEPETLKIDRITLLALSGFIAFCTPGFTAAWIANVVLARSTKTTLPVTLGSTWWSIRTGVTAPLTAAVLVALFSFWALLYVPGLLGLYPTYPGD